MHTTTRLPGHPEPLNYLRDRFLFWIFVLLAATAAGMAVLLALLPPAGHDQLWFLLMARRWLAGAEIYGPQAFDSNPPGIVWLSALPVLLSRALHLPVTFLAKSCVVIAETSASLLSFALLRRGGRATALQGTAPPSVVGEHGSCWHSPAPSWETLALLWAALVLFYVVPARDFGQRDQMLSFLVLPYLLAAGLDPLHQPLRIARCAAGLLAAVGIALKPHHALVPVAVELALLVSPSPGCAGGNRLRRLLRPEPVLIAIGGLAYAAAIHHYTPLYFSLALPIDRATYWAIGHLTVAELTLQASQLCVLAVCSTVMYLYVSHRISHSAGSATGMCGSPRTSRHTGLLIVAGCAATLVYFVQGTGWYYQQLPALSFFGAALTLDLLNLAGSSARIQRSGIVITSRPPLWGSRGAAVAATGALCALALALATYFSGSPFTAARAYAPVFADPAVPDPAFFAGLPATAPVAIFTTSVEAAMMPAQRFHLTWAQRTDNLWLLPAILRSEDSQGGHHLTPDRIRSLDDLQHRWMVEDLTRWRPVLILIARCQGPTTPCQELEAVHAPGGSLQPEKIHPDDLLVYFLRDPAFATLWRHYRWTASKGSFDAYELSSPLTN